MFFIINRDKPYHLCNSTNLSFGKKVMCNLESKSGVVTVGYVTVTGGELEWRNTCGQRGICGALAYVAAHRIWRVQ